MAAEGRIFSLDQPKTRRDILRAGCGCAFVALTCKATPSEAATQNFKGCLLTAAGYHLYRLQGEPVYPVTDSMIARNRYFRTTGDVGLDRDLDRALGMVADTFKVNPAFGFYDPSKFPYDERNDDSLRLNAWAVQRDTDILGTRGTVGFAWDLFQQELKYDSTGTSLMAIVAHEFGHILQFYRRHFAKLNVGVPLKSETNADFLSGYFLGLRGRQLRSWRFEPAGQYFIRAGRQTEGNPNRDHGNIQERLDAAEAGFRTGLLENKPLDDAVRAGLEYVQA